MRPIRSGAGVTYSLVNCTIRRARSTHTVQSKYVMKSDTKLVVSGTALQAVQFAVAVAGAVWAISTVLSIA